MNGEWRRVELPNGVSFPVRKGSAADAAFSMDGGFAREVPMSWSLGTLGDLMWMRLPETRQFLARLMANEVEAAIDQDRELMLLAGDIASDALWHPVMCPALGAYPHSRERVTAQSEVVRLAFAAEHHDREETREALVDYVFHHLRDPEYTGIVEAVDPELGSLMRSALGR